MRSAAIVINWNAWDVLEACVEALLAQTQPFAKILVIDNDSSSQSPEVFLKWTKEKNIEIKYLKSNLGFAKANNIAFELETDCDWIALINPDAYLDPTWHQQMRMASNQFPLAAGFSSALIMENDRARWDGLGDVYHISGMVWREAHGKCISDNAAEAGPVFSPCAAAAFYHRESVMNTGGFDEDYFCYLEDVDLGFRLRLKGFDCRLVPSAIAYHVGSATTGGKHSDFAVYHGHRNIVWTFVKDMPSPLFWPLLPLHILMNLATIAIFTFRGQGKIILKAKWDAIKGLPHIIRKRKAVQSARRCSTADIWRMLDKRLFIRR